MHNIIEMSRFLDIVGEQKMQISVSSKGRTLVSFLMKTTKDDVEYLRVTTGRTEGCSIDLEVNLDDLIIDGKNTRTPVDMVKVGVKALASNRGLRRKLNLLKVLIAGGAELIRYFKSKNNGHRTRAAPPKDN